MNRRVRNIARITAVTILSAVAPVGAEETDAWVCPSGKKACENVCLNTFRDQVEFHPCTSACTTCTIYPNGNGAACEPPGADYYGDILNCLNRCDIIYQCYPVI